MQRQERCVAVKIFSARALIYRPYPADSLAFFERILFGQYDVYDLEDEGTTANNKII